MSRVSHATSPPQSKRMTADERKKQLVEVTRRLIERHGISGATTARVAAAAGITEPTLYRHFGSRKGLLLAVLAAVHDDAAALIDSGRHPNALERLREIGEIHNRGLRSQKRGFADPLFEFISAPASLGLRDTVREKAFDMIISRLVRIIEEGKTQGSIRTDVDSNEMAWQIMMFFWVEDVAYLIQVQHEVLSGLSLRTLDVVLRDMAAQSVPSLA
jgi:TetR/AcrR family transcriptional regulator